MACGVLARAGRMCGCEGGVTVLVLFSLLVEGLDEGGRFSASEDWGEGDGVRSFGGGDERRGGEDARVWTGVG